jgi:NADPH:quinone reductase-like Zn-dependent oxidoreductase
VIQLAKISGFTPIITTASLENTNYLKSLGATSVLDRKLDAAGLKLALNPILGETAVQLVFDSIGSDSTQSLGLDLLDEGGKLVVTMPALVKPTDGKSVNEVHGILRLPKNVKLLETLYFDTLTEFLEKGLVKVRSKESDIWLMNFF